MAEREKHQLNDLPMEKDRLAAESMLLLSSAKSAAVDALLSLCDARLDRDICKNSDASSYLCDARLQDPSCEESLTDEGQDREIKGPTNCATQVSTLILYWFN